MIVTSSACDHSSRNGSGWPWLCLVIAAWQRSTNALSSRIEGDSCTGIVPPSVSSEGEADDADPDGTGSARAPPSSGILPGTGLGHTNAPSEESPKKCNGHVRARPPHK